MDALERDAQLLAVLDRQTRVIETIGRAVEALNRLDDERKSDIDELREEVAALAAKVDVLLRWKQALS